MVVNVPEMTKSPSIVTVDPSSSMMLLANCALPPSHFTTVLSVKLAEFLTEYSVPFANVRPVPAVSRAPVSVLTDEISIVFPFCETEVAPEATKVISPAWNVPEVVPLTLVTVSVSIEETVTVFPA